VVLKLFIRRSSPILGPTLGLLVAVGAMTLVLPAHAQRAGADSQESQANAPTRRTPAIREKVYQRLSKAQECIDLDPPDMGCVTSSLSEVREMTDLAPYERAQMWNFYAYVYFEQDNYPEAIKAYEQVLMQEELPEAMEQQTMYSLATLYVQQEEYQKGLDMLTKWFATQASPSSDAYILKAQIHYQLQQYQQGIDPVLKALDIARAQGREPQEGWYQLLNVFYFELENYPKVIETLTTLLQNWTKRDYIMQLAGIYGQEGQERDTLALYESAHAMGWLERGADLVNLAQMLMSADIPYKAAKIMQDGLDAGTIESSESNWRLLAQAWQLAQDDEKALPALSRASSLADDGNLDLLLAQSYANLARWEECIEAARSGIRRGGLNRPDQINIILGSCLVEEKQYSEARTAFRAAAQDERSRRAANDYIRYIESEEAREKSIRETMEALRRG
jgi:tetratricopeptide (TPR) repeat protein